MVVSDSRTDICRVIQYQVVLSAFVVHSIAGTVQYEMY